MSLVNCPNCTKSYLAPGEGEEVNQKVCADCESSLQSRLNRIDRNYTMKDDQSMSEQDYNKKMQKMHQEKVREVKFALSDIPKDKLSPTLAQMAEEICDPEVRDRTFCIGTIDEVELNENGVQLRDHYDPTEG